MNRNLLKLSLVAVFAAAACGQGASGESQSAASDSAQITTAQADFEAVSGEYKPDPRHRYITFNYLHFGFSNPHVRWREWDAILDWDADNPENSSVSVLIDATSVDSGVDVFDEHLQGERFFDTAKYPEITFDSTEVNISGENTGTITGDLTIKGITKPVTLEVALNRNVYDERSGYKMGFSATTKINRSDYAMDYLVPGVADEVSVIIEAEFQMPVE